VLKVAITLRVMSPVLAYRYDNPVTLDQLNHAIGLEWQPYQLSDDKSWGLVSAERDGYIHMVSRHSKQQFAGQHGDENAREGAQ
jgi:hypothetical protein